MAMGSSTWPGRTTRGGASGRSRGLVLSAWLEAVAMLVPCLSPRRSDCSLPGTCVTMSYMDTTLNVRIPAALKKQLDALSRRQHRPSSELVRESLRRYIAAEQIARLRKMTVPLAEAQGFITDDDIFKAVS